VVIAIIAILAAILFPVFAKARDRAKQASCLNNLKQIGTAVQMYANDNDERVYPQVYNEYWAMPAWIAPPRTATFPADLWATVYLPYTGKSAEVFRCPFEDAKMKRTAQGDLSFRFGAGTEGLRENQKRVSYIYVGLDIWKAGSAEIKTANGFKYIRKIVDKQSYQQQGLGEVGWLARDKDFTTTRGRLATSHSESPYPTTDTTRMAARGEVERPSAGYVRKGSPVLGRLDREPVFWSFLK